MRLDFEFSALIAETRVEGWDGYGAKPLDLKAVEHAKAFLATLPSDMPAPELSADPDGECSIAWNGRGPHVFSASFAPDGRIAWAYLNGDDSGHGQTMEYSEILPQIHEISSGLYQ